MRLSISYILSCFLRLAGIGFAPKAVLILRTDFLALLSKKFDNIRAVDCFMVFHPLSKGG